MRRAALALSARVQAARRGDSYVTVLRESIR
jgi:hypothetical protein